MDDHLTAEQVAILSLLTRIEALEREVQSLRQRLFLQRPSQRDRSGRAPIPAGNLPLTRIHAQLARVRS